MDAYIPEGPYHNGPSIRFIDGSSGPPAGSAPRPKIGEKFKCPICLVTFTVRTVNDVNLDHDKETGDIRGWLCGSYNISMGRFRDDISMLARAIIWLKKGKGDVLILYIPLTALFQHENLLLSLRNMHGR